MLKPIPAPIQQAAMRWQKRLRWPELVPAYAEIPDHKGANPMSNPLIEVTPERSTCARHREPFRAQWPLGYTRFCIDGLQMLLASDATIAATGGNVEAVNALLDKLPLCCRLKSSDLLALYSQVGIGKRGRCHFCKNIALGTVITGRIGGEVRELDHVCFVCVSRPSPFFSDMKFHFVRVEFSLTWTPIAPRAVSRIQEPRPVDRFRRAPDQSADDRRSVEGRLRATQRDLWKGNPLSHAISVLCGFLLGVLFALCCETVIFLSMPEPIDDFFRQIDWQTYKLVYPASEKCPPPPPVEHENAA